MLPQPFIHLVLRTQFLESKALVQFTFEISSKDIKGLSVVKGSPFRMEDAFLGSWQETEIRGRRFRMAQL